MYALGKFLSYLVSKPFWNDLLNISKTLPTSILLLTKIYRNKIKQIVYRKSYPFYQIKKVFDKLFKDM